jgi:amidase
MGPVMTAALGKRSVGLTREAGISCADDAIFARATEIAAAVQSRTVTASDVIEAHLRRIDRLNPKLSALITVDAEGAMAAARSVDERIAEGQHVGPLAGVPMTVKDTIEVAGMRCTGGTVGRAGFVPAADATVVARLRAAGAIVVGKGNTPEFACGFECDSLIGGRTNNPYDLKLSSGGSTGGDAAMLAGGGSALAVGTDAGGSIRLPAHFCGVAALKPTAGRTPKTGAFPYPTGIRAPLAALSPMARYVSDLAVMLPIMAGPDGRDFSVVSARLDTPDRVSIRGLRIGVLKNNALPPVTPATEGAVQAACDHLSAAGAILADTPMAGAEDAYPLWSDIFGDGGDGMRQLLKTWGSDHASSLLDRSLETIFARRLTSAAEVYALLARWDQFRLKMHRLIGEFDALVSPTNAFAAPEHGTTFDADRLEACAYTMLHNLTGWPACVVRAGSHGQLPIAVQVTAPHWREDVALAVASEIERGLGGFRRPEL